MVERVALEIRRGAVPISVREDGHKPHVPGSVPPDVAPTIVDSVISIALAEYDRLTCAIRVEPTHIRVGRHVRLRGIIVDECIRGGTRRAADVVAILRRAGDLKVDGIVRVELAGAVGSGARIRGAHQAGNAPRVWPGR